MVLPLTSVTTEEDQACEKYCSRCTSLQQQCTNEHSQCIKSTMRKGFESRWANRCGLWSDRLRHRLTDCGLLPEPKASTHPMHHSTTTAACPVSSDSNACMNNTGGQPSNCNPSIAKACHPHCLATHCSLLTFHHCQHPPT